MNYKLGSLLGVAVAGACVALVGAGCGLFGGPNSASFASVTIKGHTEEEIANVTRQVFQEDGYIGGALIGRQMVFEQEGSRMTSLAYQGVVATHGGATTLSRVRAEIVYLQSNSYRLQCQAYVVRDAGDSFFENEQRLANIRSGPYQSLLDKVAKQLK